MREKLKYTRNIITQAYVLSYCTADKIYSFFLFGWTNPLKNDRSPFALPVNTNVDLLLTDYIKRNVKTVDKFTRRDPQEKAKTGAQKYKKCRGHPMGSV